VSKRKNDDPDTPKPKKNSPTQEQLIEALQADAMVESTVCVLMHSLLE
jgi:hypothetical protein